MSTNKSTKTTINNKRTLKIAVNQLSDRDYDRFKSNVQEIIALNDERRNKLKDTERRREDEIDDVLDSFKEAGFSDDDIRSCVRELRRKKRLKENTRVVYAYEDQGETFYWSGYGEMPSMLKALVDAGHKLDDLKTEVSAEEKVV